MGFVYLLLALGCWTVWAVLSARMGGRFSPLNSLLWTGVVSAIITIGGFLVHHRQVRFPTGGDWWLLGIFCGANTVACFGYYAALKYLPGSLVLPLSHLYLVFGPVLLALMERRAMTWQQFAALCVMMTGVALFLAVTPSAEKCPRAREESQQATGTGCAGSSRKAWASSTVVTVRSGADCLRAGPMRSRNGGRASAIGQLLPNPARILNDGARNPKVARRAENRPASNKVCLASPAPNRGTRGNRGLQEAMEFAASGGLAENG